ncbi:MAG: DUF1761 domain-containing protein [Acidimicrobiia bacterium]
MDVDVNYLGIILATIAAMVVGALWYSPVAFAKPWSKLVALDESKAKKQMPIAMLTMLVGAFIKAWMLAHVTGLSNHFYKHSYLHDAFGSAFAIWFGFIMVHVLTRNMFEQKPFKLTAIILGHELVSFLVMALVIGAIGL